jgi:hypothetical protein
MLYRNDSIPDTGYHPIGESAKGETRRGHKYNNTVSGNYNTILGGTGNTDSGYSHVGIFGCNVSAVTDKALHANNFVAQGMPTSSGGAPGSIWYDPTTCIVHIIP